MLVEVLIFACLLIWILLRVVVHKEACAQATTTASANFDAGHLVSLVNLLHIG